MRLDLAHKYVIIQSPPCTLFFVCLFFWFMWTAMSYIQRIHDQTSHSKPVRGTCYKWWYYSKRIEMLSFLLVMATITSITVLAIIDLIKPKAHYHKFRLTSQLWLPLGLMQAEKNTPQKLKWKNETLWEQITQLLLKWVKLQILGSWLKTSNVSA